MSNNNLAKMILRHNVLFRFIDDNGFYIHLGVYEDFSHVKLLKKDINILNIGLSSDNLFKLWYNTLLNPWLSLNITNSESNSLHILIGLCLSAFSIVVFPNPMIDFNLNSFATLDTIGDTDELIEAAVDIVELHSSLI